MNQHARHSKNKTIHSSPQIEKCKKIVDERSIKVGGRQHITSLDKHKTTISIRGDLPFILLCPCTDKEWQTLPHAMLTSEKDWDPTCLDCEVQLCDEDVFDSQSVKR